MKTKQGFTIVELLIVIVILGVLISILAQLFGSIITTKLRSESATAVAADSRYVMTRLGYDITRASSFSVPNSSTLILNIEGFSYTYALDAGILTLTGQSGSERLISRDTNISALNFTSYPAIAGKSSVGIDLTLDSVITHRRLVTTYALR
jgi:prepilin-type N-terminal cleavage/methylation domain-containing protein